MDVNTPLNIRPKACRPTRPRTGRFWACTALVIEDKPLCLRKAMAAAVGLRSGVSNRTRRA